MTLKRFILIALGAAAAVLILQKLFGRHEEENLSWEPVKHETEAAA